MIGSSSVRSGLQSPGRDARDDLRRRLPPAERCAPDRCADDTIGEPAASVASLNRAVTVGALEIRKVTIVAVVVAAISPRGARASARAHSIGLHMRAASMDFAHRAASRRPGEPVIASAVLISRGPRRRRRGDAHRPVPARHPGFALKDTIIVLVGVVVGGMNRLFSATLGGFAIGLSRGDRRRASDRPDRLTCPRSSSASSSSCSSCGPPACSRAAGGRRGAGVNVLRAWLQLAAPAC